jgi:hypothetical protein
MCDTLNIEGMVDMPVWALADVLPHRIGPSNIVQMND